MEQGPSVPPADRPGSAPAVLPQGSLCSSPEPAFGVIHEALGAELEAHGLAVVPGFLSPAEVGLLRSCAAATRAGGRFRPAGVGRGPSFRIRPEVRGDEVYWLDAGRDGHAVSAWMARMEGLRAAINARLFLGLFGYEAHFSHYPPGASYQIHLDRFADAPLRTLSVVLYLNRNWRSGDDGRLRIYLERAGCRPWRDVMPAGGTLVAFLSDRFPHEVLPAARSRWSLTGWFTRRP
ncbi:MAG: 2OG-Fe(II) oxygenase [Gammaproteobacteria bacterium]